MLIMEQVQSHLEVPSGQRSRWHLRASLVVVGAIVSALVLAAVDRAHVASHDALSTAAFGLPLKWLNQNQSALDPPLPYNARLLSPWEYPTDFSIGLFAIDVLAVLALLVGSRFLIRSIRAAK